MKALCHVAVVAVAAFIALAGARPFAGSWNDGSRLATVEALVDYGTWAIDDSVFLCVPDGHPRPTVGTLMTARMFNRPMPGWAAPELSHEFGELVQTLAGERLRSRCAVGQQEHGVVRAHMALHRDAVECVITSGF